MTDRRAAKMALILVRLLNPAETLTNEEEAILMGVGRDTLRKLGFLWIFKMVKKCWKNTGNYCLTDSVLMGSSGTKKLFHVGKDSNRLQGGKRSYRDSSLAFTGSGRATPRSRYSYDPPVGGFLSVRAFSGYPGNAGRQTNQKVIP
jgi:hypothetical protein